MFLDYFALVLLFLVVIFIFYTVIVIHDIPYEISVHRNHPHQDAIHVAGWVSLFTLHILWPFLWIWSMLYREDRGWGFKSGSDAEQQGNSMEQRIESLEAKIESLQLHIAEQQSITKGEE